MTFERDWAAFSVPQLHVIAHLSFAMPLHAGYARHRLGMAAASIRALERKGFVRTDYLYHTGISVGVPFHCLTQTGEAPWPDLWCWGTTKSGAPKHPLARGAQRIPANQPPILWRSAK